jgi:hypothetical protein
VNLAKNSPEVEQSNEVKRVARKNFQFSFFIIFFPFYGKLRIYENIKIKMGGQKRKQISNNAFDIRFLN